MAILSGRLEALAEQVKQGETMADIGTDHGFLPIYLFQRGICPKVIMTDVSEKALSRARDHGQSIAMGEGFPVLTDENYRVGDGLSPLSPGEVDVVVLAGMGGILMSDIMAADLSKAKTIKKLVFQPRNHPEILRRWLYHNGFSILKECLVRERRNLCEIIVATPRPDAESLFDGLEMSWQEGDIRWEIPPWFGEIPDRLATEYLHKKLERELRVRREILKSQSPDPDRQHSLDNRITYLKTLLERRESHD
jgi:tRNA (adenine22-N1)-methyltransferase